MTKARKTRPEGQLPDRRQMLRTLGFAAVAAYAAPTVLSLTPAHASSASGGSGGGSSSGGSYSAPSGPRHAQGSSSGPSSAYHPRRPQHAGASCSFGSSGCRPAGRRGQRRSFTFRRLFFGSS